MDNDRLVSVCTLAEHISYGKSQITSILKNRDSNIELYELNIKTSSTRLFISGTY